MGAIIRIIKAVIIMYFKYNLTCYLLHLGCHNHTMTSNVNLRSILDANKLIGPNFLDWIRNLRIVLNVEKITYVLDSHFLSPQLLMPLKVVKGHIRSI